MPRKQRFKPSRKPKPVSPAVAEETTNEQTRDLGDGPRNPGEHEQAASRGNGHENGDAGRSAEDIESGAPGSSHKHETSVIEESETEQPG